MRSLILLTLGFVLPAAAEPALAQVTVDLHALQALPEHHAEPGAQRRLPAPRGAAAARGETTRGESAHGEITRGEAARGEPGRAGPARNETANATPGRSESGKTSTAKAESAAPPQPQPALPQNAPQTATIEPIAPPVAPPNAAPPPPPPVSATAGTVASPTNEGLSLTFAPGKSDLTPESVTQIKKLTSDVTLSDTTTFNVAAYAPGSSDDPSTARRLSLSRAMAVRQALVADGVPSPRIFVRALGEQHGSGPADRVDIDVQGAAAQAASK